MTPIPERVSFICAKHNKPFVVTAGEFSLYYHCRLKKCRAYFSFVEAQDIYRQLEEAQAKGIPLAGYRGKTKTTSFIASTDGEKITVTVTSHRFERRQKV